MIAEQTARRIAHHDEGAVARGAPLGVVEHRVVAPEKRAAARDRHVAARDLFPGSAVQRQQRPRSRMPRCRGRVDEMAHGIERSEEHTSELQSLMRISYAVFCLKK